VLAVQRDDFEIEAIVIDDGSTDETPQVAAAYPVRYLNTDCAALPGTSHQRRIVRSGTANGALTLQ